MQKISLVLADDHSIVREGLRVLLENQPDLDIIGEAADGLKTLELVEHARPDVLVLDLMMPWMNGLEIIRQATHRFPDTRIVVLTMYDDEPYVWEALSCGALGYVLKESGIEHLIRAIRLAKAGRRYISPPLTEHLVEAYAKKAKRKFSDRYAMLTERERQVLQMSAEGSTSAEIGSRLDISPRTVEAHRSNVMRKLKLKNHSELLRFAIQKGLIKPSLD